MDHADRPPRLANPMDYNLARLPAVANRSSLRSLAGPSSGKPITILTIDPIVFTMIGSDRRKLPKDSTDSRQYGSTAEFPRSRNGRSRPPSKDQSMARICCDQSPVPHLVLGLEPRPPAAQQEVEHAGAGLPGHRRPDAARARGRLRRREHRGHRLRRPRSVRHRRPDRDDRPARPDARDPDRVRDREHLHRRRRPLDHRGRELVRRPRRRDLHRRGRGHLAPVPQGVAAGLHQYRYEQIRKDRHGQGPDAPLRPGQVQRIRDGLRADLARLPVPVRVLRHHRHLRPASRGSRRPRWSSPRSTPSTSSASG